MNRAPLPSELPNVDRRKLLMGLGFLAAAGTAAARMPNVPIDYLGKRKLEDIVPKTFGDWRFQTASGLVVPTEDQMSNAIYSQLLTRVYTAGDNGLVMLLIAQSAAQNGIVQIHRPEVCYPAGGFELSPITPIEIDLGPKRIMANSLQAVSDRRDEQIIYWTRVGNHFPTSWAEQRWAVARDNLHRKVPDAVLVRMSTIGMEPAAARTLLAEFGQQLLEAMAPSARSVLIGPA